MAEQDWLGRTGWAELAGRDGGADMNRIGIVLVVIAGLVGAGLFALSAWKIPAPTVAVNKVVPNEKLAN